MIKVLLLLFSFSVYAGNLTKAEQMISYIPLVSEGDTISDITEVKGEHSYMFKVLYKKGDPIMLQFANKVDADAVYKLLKIQSEE